MLHLSHALVALAGLACLALPVSAEEKAPTRLGKVEMAYPFPAPSGDLVVFQSNMDGRWQLYTVNTESGAIARLSTSPADDTHPAFSPDGREVAFISNEPGNDDVYILDVETGERRSLSPHPGKDGHPKWSADGEWITFNRTL
ncbi:MAG: hypothetical protein RLN72_04255 [Henriciella sp.]